MVLVPLNVLGLKVVCYFPSWAGSRGDRSYGVKQIDFTLCTHVIVAFAKIDQNGIVGSPGIEGNNFGLYDTPI